ncbi:MAG TPA: hypothetical protein VND91_02155 [Candidatus Saccharimonadia bacterium]|nr:hypothetical protein [Candidatus Saccharimonadia bacterium]
MRAAIVIVLLGFCVPATAVPEERKATELETVIVEADDSFSDFAGWKEALDAAIAKAPLKERSELTAHDLEQILILQEDMPRLREAVDRMAAVIAKNPKQAMLSETEKVELVSAYVRTQAILMNVPDQLAVRCRLLHEAERRNKRAVCDFDYARAQEFLQHVAPKQSQRDRRDVKRRFSGGINVR